MHARSLGVACLVLLLARAAWAVDLFFAPPEPSGSVQVRLCPTEGVGAGSTQLVTLGFPFPRGSVTAAGLSTVRVLKGGVEVPSFVEVLTPWRHLYDASIDGASVRVARVQFRNTFAAGFPTSETVTLEWGVAARAQSLPALTDPRTAWHPVTSGTFSAADGVMEPNVFAVLPKAQLVKGILKPGRMTSFVDSIAETRDDPATIDATEHWPGFEERDRAQKNNFYSLINEDDPRVTAANLCAYKAVGEYEPWLYDRASAMFVLYFRSGFPKALREAVRASEFYRRHVKTTGYFDIKDSDDAKYSYNECLAYERWLMGDDVPLTQIAQVVSAFDDLPSRWSPTLNFWTERHVGFKLLAQTIAYEVFGGAPRADAVRTTIGDLVWLQNGAAGQIPANRVDGGLYHLGSQHDWDWDPDTLGASPWMTVLTMDAALRTYAAGEAVECANFLRRIGTFERGALRVSVDHDYDNAGGAVTMTTYGMLYDGTAGQADWADVEHSLEVAGSLAWAGYFADLLGYSGAAMRTDAASLYETYDFGVTYWVRPAAPASGLTAFRVAPWRKYGWENRPSGSLGWLMGQSGGGGGGNLPPSVALTSPTNGSSYTAPATIALAANATDADGSVARVEFFDGATSLGVDASAPWGLTITGVVAGAHTYTARATDDRGATTTSAAVGVTVLMPNLPPTVSITSPSSGSAYTAPASFTLAANAADADGTIARVDFYRGATLLGSDTTAPYSFAVSGLAAGSWPFTARATDDRGATTTSAAVSVTVNAPPNTPPTVRIPSPASGSRYAGPVNLTMTASAADPDGSVARVEFWRGATLLGTDASAPYSIVLYQLAVGTYQFTAKAYDNRGAVTSSTPVSITVTSPSNLNPGPGPAVRVLIGFRNGINGYAGTKDLTIETLYANEAWNGGHGYTNPGDEMPCYTTFGADSYTCHPLIRFDRLGLPQGSRVVSSYLQLSVDSWDTGFTVRGRYLRAPWIADPARLTWLRRDIGLNWTVPGATGDGTDTWYARSFAMTGFAGNGIQTMTVWLDTTVVQAWADGLFTADGIVLVNENQGKIAKFASSEATTVVRRPYLVLVYQP